MLCFPLFLNIDCCVLLKTECCVLLCFSQLLGDCCDVSVVFNSGANMTICSVLIRFEPTDPAVADDR